MKGYGFKQADQLTAKKLNDVNDSIAGGAIVSLPSGVTGPSVSATQIGDAIILDDITALALSDTTVGTLYGGVYMYVQYKTTTQAAALGGIAFWKGSDVGAAANAGYIVYGDAQPTTALPTLVAGIFLNAPTANYYTWVQIAGAASVLFDSTVTATAQGHSVTAKVSSVVASCADNGATVSEVTVAATIGVSCATVAASTVSKVLMTRSPFSRT